MLSKAAGVSSSRVNASLISMFRFLSYKCLKNWNMSLFWGVWGNDLCGSTNNSHLFNMCALLILKPYCSPYIFSLPPFVYTVKQIKRLFSFQTFPGDFIASYSHCSLLWLWMISLSWIVTAIVSLWFKRCTAACSADLQFISLGVTQRLSHGVTTEWPLGSLWPGFLALIQSSRKLLFIWELRSNNHLNTTQTTNITTACNWLLRAFACHLRLLSWAKLSAVGLSPLTCTCCLHF